MTQTFNSGRLFDLLPPSEQATIKRHCQNVVALAMRRRHSAPSEYVPDPEMDYTPDAAPVTDPKAEEPKRKETRWWRPAAGTKPGPKAQPKHGQRERQQDRPIRHKSKTKDGA